MAKEVLQMYDQVLRRETSSFECIDIMAKLEEIREAYRKTSRGGDNIIVDYCDASKRYAYIYYFASCHTVAVTRLVSRIKDTSPIVFCNMMKYGKEVMSICSLGGGPGSDLVGLLRARAQVSVPFTKKFRCSIVDISEGWKHSIKNVLSTYLATPSGSAYKGKLQCELLECDLPNCHSSQLMVRLANADILSLVKFISALPAIKISPTLKTIFGVMKGDAYVIILDNSSGGFYKAIQDLAIQAGLLEVFSVMCQKMKLKAKESSVGPLTVRVKPLMNASVFFTVWKKSSVLQL